MTGFPLAINAATFTKSFLDGNGNFEISTDQDAWNGLYDTNQPFSESVTTIASITFGTTASKDFQFGNSDSLKLTVGLTTGLVGTIRLVWPKDPDEVLKTYDLLEFLTDDSLYVILHFEAKADASMKGDFPVGPLSATFGIGAGGNVGYDRLMVYDRRRTVRQIMSDAFGGIRLPASVDSVPEIPAPGEVLVLRHGGYLQLSAGLSWGYALTGSQSFDVRDLRLTLDYALRIKAGVSLGYRLAGNFQIEARRGTDDGWVRYVVRKSRESEFNFAFDFGLTSDVELKGLPESADEFLGALLGTNAKTVLSYFAKAEEFTSLDRLKEKVNGLVKNWLSELSQTVLGEVLNDETFVKFLEGIKQMADLYQSIDQRIIDLYTDFLEDLPGFQQAVAALDGLTHRIDLQNMTDGTAWEIIRRVFGDELYDLLLDDSVFAELQQFAARLKSFVTNAGTEALRNVIGLIKEKLNPTKLLTELADYDTPEKLQHLADEKLQELVGRLIGKSFKEIKAGEFGKVFGDINSVLESIQQFKGKWYESLRKGVHQTFSFNLHFAYSRAKKDEVLLDVELNLGEAQGQALARKASAGDFAEVIDRFNVAFVRINRGILTHTLTKQAALQINVLGWSFSRVVEVIQKATVAVEVENGSLINVYTLDSQISERRQHGGKFKETVQSNFLMRIIGEVVKPTGAKDYMLGVLRDMSAQYELVQTDDLTDEEELFAYLEFGEFMGLIPDRRRLLEQLKVEFPKGFGKVSLKYVVRYDPSVFQNAFTLSGDELRDVARQTMRLLIGTKYIGMPSNHWQRVLGFAYQLPYYSQKYAQGFTVLLTDHSTITLPAWMAKNGPRQLSLRDEDRKLLATLFSIEKSYLERLEKLDNLVDEALTNRTSIPISDLEQAARKVVEMADDLGQFRENTFFAVLDKLIQVGSSGKGRRESAMFLEITPPWGETVVKTLMA